MRSVKTIKAGLPPCCMVAVDGRLVIGTYKLDDSGSRSRAGSLEVYTAELELESSVATKSAVLDIALHENLIYAAHSTGLVSVWRLEKGLVHQTDIVLGEEDQLVLQLDFRGPKMAASLTDGSAIVYDLGAQQPDWQSPLHDLEPWSVRFGEGGLWTGGDDQALCFSDLRQGTRLLRLKHHDAGVTSILPLSNELWTGGYDDKLRVLDLRTRRQVDSLDLGGGVWRLLPNPADQKQVLACLMYNGLATLRQQAELELPVVEEVQQGVHESMVYGGAWLGSSAYTCSFYDLLVQQTSHA